MPASLSNLASILKNNQLTNKLKLGTSRADTSQKSGQRPLLPLPKTSPSNGATSSGNQIKSLPETQRQLSSESNDDQMYQNVENPEISSEIERYTAAYPFEGIEVGEVRLGVGDLVDVLGKNVSGWWYVKVLEGKGVGEGWVPSSYLQPSDKEVTEGATGFDPPDGPMDSIYEEVKHYGYDDDDASTEWSDTPTSSSVDVPTWSLVQTTATVEHIPDTEAAAIQNDSLQGVDLDKSKDKTVSKNQFDKARSLEDVARLDDYVKSSFKGPRPVLPTKKTKDAENSQRQETGSHFNSISSQSTSPRSLQNDSSKISSSIGASPFGVSLKPAGAGSSARAASADPVSSKPVLPAKKPPVSTNKPSVSHDKPSPSVKPAVTALKPVLGTKPEAGLKPHIPGNKPAPPSQNKPSSSKPLISTAKPTIGHAKPQVKATKPSPPTNKPLDSRTKPRIQSKTTQPKRDLNRTNSGSNPPVKSGGLESSLGSRNGNPEKVDNNMSSKVQNLAKLFNQT